jgi:endonuclease/exonuclease/phosphatase family metal-dependent hydrolase
MNLRFGIALLLLALTGCREKEPPRAVAVREDGTLALSLCSFNVRYENESDKSWRSWPNRIDRVVRTIRRLDPDVMGVQEALHGQAADLRASLPDYAFHGVGRDDGKRAGEYAAIFYNAGRFEPDPADRGTFWLSDFPERPGSRTWGNSVVRCTTWIRLTDRASGRGFYVFNTHWSHHHQESRVKAARLIAERIAARRHPAEPVVLLGDFNATEGNPAVRLFIHGGLDDPYRRLHPDEPNRRTLHFWDGNFDGPLKVDHILVSKGARFQAADIHRAAQRKEQPSDHYPVWAKIEWPGS